MRKGILHAVCAFGAWGLLPIYWRLLRHIPAPQLLGHRILWSFLMLVVMMAASRGLRSLVREARSPRVLWAYAIAALLIGANWLTFVWAVNSGFIVEVSLGYFINPLFNVLLGVVFLRERPRPGQWMALSLAAIGVAYLAVVYGSLPWIALVLAGTFGLYGLAKKTAPLDTLRGLTLETALLAIPALALLAWYHNAGVGAFTLDDIGTDLLLIGTAFATAVPLLFFASAARSIPLTLLGMLQYIAPTMQFLLGVVVYGEAFSTRQFVGFSIVWAALILLAIEGVAASRKRNRAKADLGARSAEAEPDVMPAE